MAQLLEEILLRKSISFANSSRKVYLREGEFFFCNVSGGFFWGGPAVHFFNCF